MFHLNCIILTACPFRLWRHSLERRRSQGDPRPKELGKMFPGLMIISTVPEPSIRLSCQNRKEYGQSPYLLSHPCPIAKFRGKSRCWTISATRNFISSDRRTPTPERRICCQFRMVGPAGVDRHRSRSRTGLTVHPRLIFLYAGVSSLTFIDPLFHAAEQWPCAYHHLYQSRATTPPCVGVSLTMRSSRLRLWLDRFHSTPLADHLSQFASGSL